VNILWSKKLLFLFLKTEMPKYANFEITLAPMGGGWGGGGFFPTLRPRSLENNQTKKNCTCFASQPWQFFQAFKKWKE
jgi:hypothetical protein